jgi:hypothetical protein
MTDPASADMPVAIDRVDFTRSDRDGIELRVTGRWLAPEPDGAAEPLLVVQVSGRRHRFAPVREAFVPPPGILEATFRIPPWAQPRHEGQAALWVGTSVVPVPLPGGSPDGGHRPPPAPALGEARAWPPDVAPPPAEVASLQGALADAKSDLEASGARQSALEAAHTELRGELQELMSAISAQRDEYERRLSEAEERVATAQQWAVAAEAERDRLRAELEAQLTSAQVSRDTAGGEVAGLRAELERLASELAITREHESAKGADLGEARQLLAEARSLREQLHSQSSQ